MTGLTLLPSFSRRGGTEGDGVVTWEFFTPTTPPAAAGTPTANRTEAAGVRRLERAQARSSNSRLTLRQEEISFC
jgi:hypothetical protein